jgi:hypothetical protein
MITTTALLLTGLLAAPQDAKPKPDPELDPKIVVAKIEAALEQGGMPAVETIKKYGVVPAKSVTSLVGDALRNKEELIRTAAIQALRYNPDKTAFVELLNQRGNKSILGNAKSAEQYYLSLGQHADKRALPYLIRDLGGRGRRDPVLRAKVLAIGRIKEWGSIDALIKFVLRGGRRSSARDSAFTSLTVLTGHKEHKGNAIAWARWWKANRRKFKFPDKEPELSKVQARIWTSTWAVPGSAKDAKKVRKKGNEAADEQGGTKDGDDKKKRRRKRKKI